MEPLSLGLAYLTLTGGNSRARVSRYERNTTAHLAALVKLTAPLTALAKHHGQGRGACAHPGFFRYETCPERKPQPQPQPNPIPPTSTNLNQPQPQPPYPEPTPTNPNQPQPSTTLDQHLNHPRPLHLNLLNHSTSTSTTHHNNTPTTSNHPYHTPTELPHQGTRSATRGGVGPVIMGSSPAYWLRGCLSAGSSLRLSGRAGGREQGLL